MTVTGASLTSAGRLTEAEPLLREGLQRHEALLQATVSAANQWAVADGQRLLGRCLALQGRHEEAIALLEPALQAARPLGRQGDAQRIAEMLSNSYEAIGAEHKINAPSAAR